MKFLLVFFFLSSVEEILTKWGADTEGVQGECGGRVRAVCVTLCVLCR